ncbi:hypothetical protein ACN28S_10265 [Cystobacter fuscus]
MSDPRRPLQVFPDAARRQAALRAARRDSGVVRGDLFLDWAGFLDALGGVRELGRRPCPPLAARTVVASLAQGLGPTPLGDFVHEPAFARAALEVLLDLKAGRLSPRELQDALEVLPPSGATASGRSPCCTMPTSGRWRSWASPIVRTACEGPARRWSAASGPRPGPTWGRSCCAVSMTSGPRRWSCCWPWRRRVSRAGWACAWRRRWVALPWRTRPWRPSSAPSRTAARCSPTWTSSRRTSPSSPVRWASWAVISSPRAPKDALVGAVEGLSLWSAATARDEARLIARDVRRLVSEGVPPGHIAVAWRDLSHEAHWVAEALGELDVPVRLPWGEPLALTGPVRLALDLPLLVEDGFPAERVADVLSSRYAPRLSAGAPEAPATLLSLAAVRDDRLGASRGKGAYDVRLDALARRLTPLPEQVRPKDERRAHEVRVLRERCLMLIEACRLIPEQGRASELLTAWWQVVRRLGLLDSEGTPETPAEEGLGALAVEARARDDAARRALVARVRELERMLAVVGGGPRLRRRTFGRWLADAMRDVHLPPRGSAVGAVEVLEVGELEGRTFAHVFLGGLAEGRFRATRCPTRCSETPSAMRSTSTWAATSSASPVASSRTARPGGSPRTGSCSPASWWPPSTR